MFEKTEENTSVYLRDISLLFTQNLAAMLQSKCEKESENSENKYFRFFSCFLMSKEVILDKFDCKPEPDLKNKLGGTTRGGDS
mmetsp:Transcript_41714/g.48170  ORF Transcript_41714/g.48170 Transcript_41714/m.48170 type:complete len:83 (-) Transcript_41714:95-343(-)